MMLRRRTSLGAEHTAPAALIAQPELQMIFAALQIDPRALDDAEAQDKPWELSRQPSTAESCLSGKDYMMEVGTGHDRKNHCSLGCTRTHCMA
jgi:hypothetical protein